MTLISKLECIQTGGHRYGSTFIIRPVPTVDVRFSKCVRCGHIESERRDYSHLKIPIEMTPVADAVSRTLRRVI